MDHGRELSCETALITAARRVIEVGTGPEPIVVPATPACDDVATSVEELGADLARRHVVPGSPSGSSLFESFADEIH